MPVQPWNLAQGRHIVNTVSAIVLTYNNEDIIQRFAQSVAWTDELVVVDSGSRDRTLDIVEAHHHNCRLVTRRFDHFSNQRNFGLQHATSDWVMHFDSDHVMTRELKEEIQALLQGQPTHRVYNAHQRLFWRKQLLSHASGPVGFGGFLHRRDAARFESPIHEKLVSEHSVGMLRQSLDHVTDQTLKQRITQMAEYVEREVDAILAGQRRIVAGRWNMIWRPMRRLLRDVVLKRAYRDGAPGMAWALLTAARMFLVQFRYWEATKGAWGDYPVGEPLGPQPATGGQRLRSRSA